MSAIPHATVPDALSPLAVDECLAALGTTRLGRVAVVSDGVPVILPVTYAVVDGSVVFRTRQGTLLEAARRGAVVAFEADAVDEEAHTGWSVLVTGRGQEVWDEVEAETSRRQVGEPVAGGDRPRVVRILSGAITGRRVRREPGRASTWWG